MLEPYPWPVPPTNPDLAPRPTVFLPGPAFTRLSRRLGLLNTVPNLVLERISPTLLTKGFSEVDRLPVYIGIVHLLPPELEVEMNLPPNRLDDE